MRRRLGRHLEPVWIWRGRRPHPRGGPFVPRATSVCCWQILSRWKEGAGASACLDCEAGKYSAAEVATSASSCLKCEAGKYSAAEGATSASSCLASSPAATVMPTQTLTAIMAALLTYLPPRLCEPIRCSRAKLTHENVYEDETVMRVRKTSVLMLMRSAAALTTIDCILALDCVGEGAAVE